MATLEQIGAALKKAHAAGDVAAAKKLAAAYKAMQAQQASGTVTPQQAAPAPEPQQSSQPGAGPMDFLSQGLSGLNEGIAAGLGAPVDLTTMLLNAGSTGINYLAGTNLPKIEHPFGGGETFRGLLSPTIGKESTDPALQITRRIGQEVGAFTIPGMGAIGKSAKPLATAGKELATALGSGTGAAVAQQAFPGNPLAEFAGQMIGGLTPGGIARTATKPGKGFASVEDLKAATDAAYEKTRTMGVAYSPKAYEDMLVTLTKEANADGISPERHKAAYSFINDLIANRGQPLSLTELDQIRQRVRRDLITPSYGNTEKAADAHFGQMILDNIDELIARAKPADMVAGDAKAAANAILEARSLNTKMRKAELLQDAVERAKLAAAASGSGGNINNAIRQQIKGILTSPKKSRSFTKEEIAMMQQVVQGGKIENFARLVGKLSPSGNGLMAALGIGATAANPFMAAAPVAGMVAKSVADNATMNNVTRLQKQVAGGIPSVPRKPFLTPAEMTAMLAGQGVGQLAPGPVQITVRGGAR